ncbi:AT-rich interactive domain-containing protein 6-like isoform X2 [Aristolochia californica]|uniref:AT-rich interactive domain-containing protein 6-like isoform X2 n=1 Tax=Aristolochia californica TaxID=171875 RepID=UPI0035DB97ED
MSEAKEKEMSEIHDEEEIGQNLSEARENEVGEIKVAQDDKTEVGEEVTVAREDDRGEEAAEEAGEETAGPEETEAEKEGVQPSSGSPSENIETDQKDPQVPSEAMASEPTATVEPPSPGHIVINQTEETSQVNNDNDEQQVLIDEPENAATSEENIDTSVKEENGEETIQRDGVIDADIIQSKENFAQEVPLKQDITAEEPAVNANQSFSFDAHMGDGDESGTEEEQAAFMKELENFFRERNLEFKPPKFYGEGLNCLKLWRAVTRLGGYDQVTSCKLWRQVGESFKPPKTCTTVSWSFRCFYEKALLEYERHKVRGGELRVATSPLSEPVGVDNQVGGSQASGSGRARRDAAARAMQGWHSQRLLGNGEDKSSVSLPKREKQLKSLSLLKRKKPSTLERAVKVARTKGANPREMQIGSQAVRMDTMVADVGPAADWVKINVRRTKDCYEVYALVPGLLREEVRVQSDASGRLVISGDPEQPDNPWGVTPFKKVVSLPSRIDAHQTSAVVTLHGQLFVRAPFEQSDL